jgi:hypothetical protein
MAIMAGTGTAWGQATPPTVASPAPTPAAKAEARERFDRGLRLFENGENASALAEFKRANELIPTPLVLYNMGLVYAAMNRPVEAVDTLGAFLTQASPAQRERRHASAIRDEQAARIAQLLVKTETPATIDVDGVEVGHTPLGAPIRLASGAHIVGAQAPGYLPSRKEVTLAGQVTETLALALLPAANRMAQLSVSSSPTAAEVLVNGKGVGLTPLAASVSVSPGVVRVEVRRPGYFRAERSLELGDGARGDLSFALEEDPGAPPSTKGLLRIVASESDIEVAVDGVSRGIGGAPMRVPGGPHEVRVTRLGFEPYAKTVNVVSGGETPLAVILVPTPETRTRYEHGIGTRRILGWSALGVGAAMAIAGSVYGVMKLKDVSDARNNLSQVLANEADRTNQCYAQGLDYGLRQCDVTKSNAQNQVDSAVLRRNLGFVGAGVGVLAAGLGTYLLLTNGDPNRYRETTSLANANISGMFFWTDGASGGLSIAGHY